MIIPLDNDPNHGASAKFSDGGTAVLYGSAQDIDYVYIDDSGTGQKAASGINGSFIDGDFTITTEFSPYGSLTSRFSDAVSVATLDDQNLIVAWEGPHIYGTPDLSSIYGRVLNRDGVPKTDTFLLSSEDNARLMQPQLVSSSAEDGFTLGYTTRDGGLYLDHWSYDNTSGGVSVSRDQSDSALVPSGHGEIFDFQLFEHGGGLLVGAISGGGDVGVWGLSGGPGSMQAGALQSLTDNLNQDAYSTQHRALQATQLDNGGAVLTYNGVTDDRLERTYAGDNTKLDYKLIARVISPDGGVSSEIPLGQVPREWRDVKVLSTGADTWAVSWVGLGNEVTTDPGVNYKSFEGTQLKEQDFTATTSSPRDSLAIADQNGESLVLTSDGDQYRLRTIDYENNSPSGDVLITADAFRQNEELTADTSSLADADA